MRSVGEKIAELRKEQKMTQEEFSALLGVSPQSVSKWENNVTAPDIVLLPLIAGIFDVTVDALFSIDAKQTRQSRPSVEETPKAIYDAVLKTMWEFDQEFEQTDTEKLKERLREHPNQHTGVASAKNGAIYADRDLAVVFLADETSSSDLLSKESAADFLRTLADPAVRKILNYQLNHRGVSFTVPTVSAKCGIPEEETKTALDTLVRYALSQKRTLDMGEGEVLDIYSHYGDHKLPLLIAPILSMADKLSDFQESWFGFCCNV